MTLRYLFEHFQNRLSELATTLMMLALAVHIAIWPSSIGASAFRGILEVLPETLLGLGFALAGWMRLAALIANGAWPQVGPWLRAAGAVSGAFIWLQMCVALYQLVPTVGTPPSPGIPVYFVLTLLELASAYRALVMVDNGKAA